MQENSEQPQECVAPVEATQTTSSLFSDSDTASDVQQENGTVRSRRRKVRKYRLKAALTAEQVAAVQRILGLDLDKFEEVKERKRAPDEPKESANAAFWTFWRLYPRHDIVGAALRAWKKLSPDSETVEKIFRDVKKRCDSADWRKDGGKWIPFAHTYLANQRWLDEGVVNNNIITRRTVI